MNPVAQPPSRNRTYASIVDTIVTIDGKIFIDCNGISLGADWLELEAYLGYSPETLRPALEGKSFRVMIHEPEPRPDELLGDVLLDRSFENMRLVSRVDHCKDNGPCMARLRFEVAK
jgi:hypothetical protein